MLDEFTKALNSLAQKFQSDLQQIRGHRLTGAFLENIMVPAYGKTYPLKGLASIAFTSSTTAHVELWDVELAASVDRYLRETHNHLAVNREGNTLKISLPVLTEESRRQILKALSETKEEVRIKARKERDEILKKSKHDQQEKRISEDQFFRMKEKADEEIEKFNKKVEELFEQKEREILG